MAEKGQFTVQNEDDLAAANTSKLSARELELQDIRKVVSTREGRRFLWRLLAEAKVFGSCFTGNSATFFNEGRREFGVFLLTEMLQADKQAYMLMQDENIPPSGSSLT